MNFSNQPQSQHDFQIAPMIDIVFLLLVFFIVSYSMAEIERELSITLPEASKAKESSSRINDIVINITIDGNTIVNKRKMSISALHDRLKKLSEFGAPPSVIIRADEMCKHKDVIKVIDVCARVKAKNILFSTAGNNLHEK
ncbi:MAG: ExbD/TolR family protein [Planctomycetota bacterium]|jgi:biopolymer transport protein ExbD